MRPHPHYRLFLRFEGRMILDNAPIRVVAALGARLNMNVAIFLLPSRIPNDSDLLGFAE